jgi:hypothetical protein
MAVRLVDRQRMHSEDRYFDRASSLYLGTVGDKPVPTKERIVAIEVNEDRIDGQKYLYTLTDFVLYRENISDPTQPSNEVFFPLFATPLVPIGGYLEDWEQPMDFKGGTTPRTRRGARSCCSPTPGSWCSRTRLASSSSRAPPTSCSTRVPGESSTTRPTPTSTASR